MASYTRPVRDTGRIITMTEGTRKIRSTFRRRQIVVDSGSFRDIEGKYPTELFVRRDLVGIRQDRGKYARNELVLLDKKAVEYLIKLWGEVYGE